MAKRHCSKHKRYVHNCPGCQSEVLRETVGFPKTEGDELPPRPSEEPPNAPDADDDGEDEEGGDIAEWEPEVEDDPTPVLLPSYVPSPENACDEHPNGCPEPGTEGSHTPADPDLEPVAEIDGDGNIVPLTPREAAEEVIGDMLDEASDAIDEAVSSSQQMSPIEKAMAVFPQRLIPEGATEVCDEERPDEPYMASYEELVRRAVAGYLEMGLNPEDAVIVVGAEVIKAEQLGAGEATEALTEEELEAFDAGLEAAPEITGCIEDYNQGFNEGMAALLSTLRGYYSGDEDAVAYSMLQWLEAQAAKAKK